MDFTSFPCGNIFFRGTPVVFTTQQSVNPCERHDGKTQPSLGGDPNGPSCGVGHAELRQPDHSDCRAKSEHRGRKLDDTRSTELHGIPSQQRQEDPASWESGDGDLYTSCDNRTDELRLLGNGVVPATAELAFRTLWAELNKTN